MVHLRHLLVHRPCADTQKRFARARRSRTAPCSRPRWVTDSTRCSPVTSAALRGVDRARHRGMASSLCLGFGGVSCGHSKRVSSRTHGLRSRHPASPVRAGFDDAASSSVTTVERASTVSADCENSDSVALVSSQTREQCLPTTAGTAPAVVTAFLKRKGRHARFSASLTGGVEVFESQAAKETGRGLREYMSLPASQYNTLDGETVTRKGEDVFVCELGNLDFLGFKVKPVLTARVEVQPGGRGTVIRVEHATVSGSRLVEKTDDLFEIQSTNRVGWRYVGDADSDVSDTPDSNRQPQSPNARPLTNVCEIASATEVCVYLLVPNWFPFTVKATERTGNFVVGQVVKQVVPRFLKQLKEDYYVWSKGDDSREATSAGVLFDVDVEGR